MSFCGQCGSSVTGTRFCTTCGAPTTAPTALPATESGAAPSASAPRLPTGAVTEKQPSLGEPAAPPSTRRPSRRVWWLVGGVVAIAAIGVGVGVVAVKQVAGVSGAETPEAAVVGLVQAINDKDLIRAATLLPPDELEQFSDALTSAGDALTRTGVVDAGASGEDLSTLLSGLSVSVRGLQVHSELVEPDLAQVTIVGGTLEAAVDPSATTGLLHTALANTDVASTGASFTLDIAQVNAKLDRPIMVAAVQRGGSWFVSTTYTAGEYLLRRTGAKRAPAAQADGRQAVYATPEEAAKGLLDQVGAAVNSHDSAELADALVPGEAQALLTYRRGIDKMLENLKVRAQDWDATFQVVESTGNTAIVRPTLITIDGSDGYHSGSIEIQDGCFLLNGENRGCLSDGGTSGELNDLLVGTNPDVDLDLVVTRVGDGWRVSLGATALHSVTKVLDGISSSQTRLIVANALGDRQARAQLLVGLPADRQVNLDQQVALEFGDTEAYKVVEVVVEPGQSLEYVNHPALSEACVLGGIYSAGGEQLTEIDEPGTYRLLAVGVVQNDDGYYRYVHTNSCAIRIDSR